jgi:pantoate--beta-alanine ligase
MFVGCTTASYMICHTKVELKNLLQSDKNKPGSTGFVPTMGALHTGHISLVKKALEENDTVAVSIFVNPTQFNNSVDLSKYPRTLESDVTLLKSSIDFKRVIVFAPDAYEIYGNDHTAKPYSFGSLDHVMEGANRPGHFNGVGTILELLFKLVQPDKAYFGEKDFQQLQVVRSLVKQLQLPVLIVGCPILRESNHLAMSSRNERLDTLHREKAGIIYQSLLQAKKLYRNDSLQSALDYVNHLYSELNEFELEYFTITDEENLTTLTQQDSKITARGFIVVHIQGVRLIDNLQF